MSDRNIKNQVQKILMNIVARTAGWRSSLSNGAWISSLSNGAHWRKPNKRRRGPGAETSLQQPQHHSQRKLTLSNVLFQFLLGVRRGRTARRMPYEMLVPRCERHLAACELPFYKSALRAVSLALWQLWDGDGCGHLILHCHFQRIL